MGEGGTILFYNGTSWQTKASGTPDDYNHDLYSVMATDASHIWACGYQGVLFSSGAGFAQDPGMTVTMRRTCGRWTTATSGP